MADENNMKAAERLRRYWSSSGQGGMVKIRWGTEGDWTRCVRELSKYMTRDEAEGYCQNLHKRNTGVYTGDKRNVGNKDD